MDKITSVDDNFIFSSNNKLTADEREIVINYSEYDKVWYAESSIPKFWRKLEKQGWICTNTQYYADGTICSKSFTSSNSKGITITNPNKTRHVSDELKAQMAERFRAYHESKHKDENNLVEVEDE